MCQTTELFTYASCTHRTVVLHTVLLNTAPKCFARTRCLHLTNFRPNSINISNQLNTFKEHRSLYFSLQQLPIYAFFRITISLKFPHSRRIHIRKHILTSLTIRQVYCLFDIESTNTNISEPTEKSILNLLELLENLQKKKQTYDETNKCDWSICVWKLFT